MTLVGSSLGSWHRDVSTLILSWGLNRRSCPLFWGAGRAELPSPVVILTSTLGRAPKSFPTASTHFTFHLPPPSSDPQHHPSNAGLWLWEPGPVPVGETVPGCRDNSEHCSAPVGGRAGKVEPRRLPSSQLTPQKDPGNEVTLINNRIIRGSGGGGINNSSGEPLRLKRWFCSVNKEGVQPCGLHTELQLAASKIQGPLGRHLRVL